MLTSAAKAFWRPDANSSFQSLPLFLWSQVFFALFCCHNKRREPEIMQMPTIQKNARIKIKTGKERKKEKESNLFLLEWRRKRIRRRKKSCCCWHLRWLEKFISRLCLTIAGDALPFSTCWYGKLPRLSTGMEWLPFLSWSLAWADEFSQICPLSSPCTPLVLNGKTSGIDLSDNRSWAWAKELIECCPFLFPVSGWGVGCSLKRSLSVFVRT